ncbi:uncharacterized protein LOC142350459 [Convolutriloba macropyga]|uniref:uncharacterized protein LOC142350459 n=1 Tax=Convolutriloba macropyga TaxID=536237 RepID=UPI003F521C32
MCFSDQEFITKGAISKNTKNQKRGENQTIFRFRDPDEFFAVDLEDPSLSPEEVNRISVCQWKYKQLQLYREAEWLFLQPYFMFNGELFLIPLKCGDHGTIAWIMAALFLLLGNALMLNLLVAIYAAIFNDVQENSEREWKMEMYWLLKDFEAKTILPPPLSLIETGVQIIAIIRRRCKERNQTKSEPSAAENRTLSAAQSRKRRTQSNTDSFSDSHASPVHSSVEGTGGQSSSGCQGQTDSRKISADSMGSEKQLTPDNEVNGSNDNNSSSNNSQENKQNRIVERLQIFESYCVGKALRKLSQKKTSYDSVVDMIQDTETQLGKVQDCKTMIHNVRRMIQTQRARRKARRKQQQQQQLQSSQQQEQQTK